MILNRPKRCLPRAFIPVVKLTLLQSSTTYGQRSVTRNDDSDRRLVTGRSNRVRETTRQLDRRRPNNAEPTTSVRPPPQPDRRPRSSPPTITFHAERLPSRYTTKRAVFVAEHSTAVKGRRPSTSRRTCSYVALLAAARLPLIFIYYYFYFFGVCDFNR